MSNTVSYSYDINYISQQKKILVGRNNNTIYQKFKLDNQIQDTYYFQVVSKNNQIVDLSGFDYQFFGSYIDAKQTLHVLFFSDEYTIENNVLSFKVNTYTSEYLNYVKVPRQIELTIKKKADNLQQVILRDTGLAYPSPIIPGQEPTEVIAGFGLDINGFLISLTGTVLSGDNSTIAINDNVISYIGPSGNTYIAGEGIGIDNDVISLTATIPSSVTQLDGTRNLVGTINNGTYISKSEIVDMIGNNPKTVSLDIKMNTLANALSSNYGFALTNQIPTSTSQLTNDSNYTTSSYVQSVSGTITGWVDEQDYADIDYVKGRVNISPIYNDTVTHSQNNYILPYNSKMNIYKTKHYAYSDGKVYINALSTVPSNNTAITIEHHIEGFDIGGIVFDGFVIDQNINVIGDLPSTFVTGTTYVFTRRLININNTTTEFISFAYSY